MSMLSVVAAHQSADSPSSAVRSKFLSFSDGWVEPSDVQFKTMSTVPNLNDTVKPDAVAHGRTSPAEFDSRYCKRMILFGQSTNPKMNPMMIPMMNPTINSISVL